MPTRIKYETANCGSKDRLPLKWESNEHFLWGYFSDYHRRTDFHLANLCTYAWDTGNIFCVLYVCLGHGEYLCFCLSPKSVAQSQALINLRAAVKYPCFNANSSVNFLYIQFQNQGLWWPHPNRLNQAPIIL